MASKTLISKLTPCFSAARSPSLLRRIRPVASTAGDIFRCKIPNHPFAVRSYSSRPTTSSLNDPSPNWSNRPPKETILLDGCDFEHWLCVVETPDPNWTRDQIIDHYIKILAKIVGSEEEARMKIYSVSTKHYFAFGANVSEEVSYKLKELPELRWVLPDSYLDVKNKDYGGEPFINGEAVPYDPKYHEEWVRNNARANERSRRNDRPRNFDRSRNFERRGEMRSGGPAPPMNQGYQGSSNPNTPPPQNATQSPPPPMQNPNFNRPPPPSQGPPSPNVGFQNQNSNPNYQGSGGGYQGGNTGYQPNPNNPNMPPPQYATQSPPPPIQNPNFNRPPPPPAQNYYQGGGPGYQGGNPGYQQGGGAPGYQQGGAPGYQSNAGGYANYQGNPNPIPNQSGGGAYPGGNAGGYQGGNPPSQGADVPGGDKGY